MTHPLWRVMIVVLLVLAEALMTCMENALRKANECFFEKKVEEEQDKKAQMVLNLLEKENWYINTAQMVRITANLTIGAIYSTELLSYARTAASYVSADNNMSGWLSVFLILFAIILVLAVMFFGVIIPGRLVGRNPDQVAYRVGGLMNAWIQLCKPFITILDGAMGIVLMILQIRPEELEDNVTEEEIISIVNEGFEQGVLEDNEVEMISNIIELGEKEVRDVMTHRKKVVAVNSEMSIEEALKFMLDESYSRFPLYEEERDNIVGVLHLKDVTQYYVTGRNLDAPLKNLAREPYFVPDTQDLDVLFENMQSKKIQMAILQLVKIQILNV